MSAKKNIPPKKAASKPVPVKKDSAINTYILLAVALIVTLICFSNAFKGEFTNWDDFNYVVNNDLIKSLSWQNIKAIFSTPSVMGNYHPLAVLSLALDYHFNKLEPHGFHATSIIIHLCNVALVFGFVQLLVKKPVVAFIAALLFGIHPMHVESVAWVAERKDVLYVFFYMASLIMYLLYIKAKENRILYLVLAFVLFACSVLSKAQAVTLPVVLLLIDYFRNRKFDDLWLWVEKTPFLILAAYMGIVAVHAQKLTGAILDIPTNSIFDRILFASYSFIDYTMKLIYPGSLSAYYPYPDKPISAIYYVAPFVVLGLVALAVKYYKDKPVLFGSSFYVVNIFLLLQLLPVGGAMMAERYTYLCSIGLFFMAGSKLNDLWENKKMSTYKYPTMAVMMGYGVFLCYGTYQRNKVWNNSEVLWRNVIQQYKNVPIAYNDLGSYYQKHKQLDSALANFNEAIRLNSTFAEALINRSDIFRTSGNFTQAIADCDTAIAHNRDYTEAYMNRGIAYCNINKVDEALRDFAFVASKKTNDPSLYSNRGNLYDMKGKLDSALSDYSMVIQLDPENADAYVSRGRTYYEMKKYKEALADLNTGLGMDATLKNGYIYRAEVYKETGNYAGALQDAMTAKSMGVQLNEQYISELKKHLPEGK